MSPEQSHTAIGGWVGEASVGCGVAVGVKVGSAVGEAETVAVGRFVFVGIGLFVGEGAGVLGTAVASSVDTGDVKVRVGSIVRKVESSRENTHEPPKKTSAPNNKTPATFRRIVKEQKRFKVRLRAFFLVIFITCLPISSSSNRSVGEG
ncbi:MAG: hypothetical protein GY803_28170 [Chloroflexi bacterium]|nr:hypothetical protein [Chloroflexota bacterium]